LEYTDFEVVLVKYGLIVFYSYQHGLMAEKMLKKNNIPVEFVPTPRSITESCSHSLKFGLESLRVVQNLLQRLNIPYKGIYEVERIPAGYKIVKII